MRSMTTCDDEVMCTTVHYMTTEDEGEGLDDLSEAHYKALPKGLGLDPVCGLEQATASSCAFGGGAKRG